MKLYIPVVLLLILNGSALSAQKLDASQILEKAIHYHDPNGNWDQFTSTFQVTMTTPASPERVSTITINLPADYFNLVAKRDGDTTRFTLDKGRCKTSITDSIAQAGVRTPCETATLYKNYYTYLYGLPMKLKDPGANLAPTVEKVTFKEKNT